MKVFGFATFGRVYGTIIALSGMVNLFQPVIDAMNHDVFHDNPIPINAMLACLGFVFGVSLVIYVWMQRRKAVREREEWEAQVGQYKVIVEEEDDDVPSWWLDSE